MPQTRSRSRSSRNLSKLNSVFHSNLIILDNNTHPLLLAADNTRFQLDKSVQWDAQVGYLLSRQIEEVGIQATKNSLMTHNNQRLSLSLKLKDYRLQSIDHIHVRFSAGISVAQLVMVTGAELLGELRLHLIIGQAVAYADFNLTKSPPLNQALASDTHSGFLSAAHR